MVFLERISFWVARVTGVVATVMAAMLVGSLIISIFFRYVIGSALSWPEEISLILFVWIVLLTGSMGVRQDFHVRLTIFVSKLPKTPRIILERIVLVLIAAFGWLLMYSGYDLIERTAENLTPTLRLPLDWINYSAPVCGAMILLHSLTRLVAPEIKGDQDE